MIQPTQTCVIGERKKKKIFNHSIGNDFLLPPWVQYSITENIPLMYMLLNKDKTAGKLKWPCQINKVID